MLDQTPSSTYDTPTTDSTAHMLQSMIDLSNNAIMYCEAIGEQGQIKDFVYRLANQALYDLVGQPAEQVLGQTMTQLFPGVKTNGLLERYIQVVQTGQPQEFEFGYEADGYHGWFMITAKPLNKGFVLSLVDITARRRIEEQKQRHAEQLQFVTDSALTAISLYSIVRDVETGEVIDLRYELINQMAEKMTGRRSRELVGRTMLDVFPGIAASGIWDRYQELARTGVPLRYQNHYTYDGYDLWYEVQGVRRNDYIVLSFLDITNLKQAQQEQQQQADEFRQILNNALTAVSHFTAVRDENGQIIDFIYRSFNHTSEVITGRKAEDIVDKRMLELFPGVRTSGVFDRWVNLMATGGQVRFQDHYNFDDFNFWFDTQAVKWGDGFIQSYIDITPVKEGELARQQQADFLTLLLQTSLSGIIAYEAVREPVKPDAVRSPGGQVMAGLIRDFRPIFFNTAYEQIFEESADRIWNLMFRERFPDEIQGDLFTFYVQLTETGQAFRREHYYPHLDKWLDVTGTKLQDGFLIIVDDITVRKRDEYQKQQQADALEWANQQLARSNDNLEQFAYVASHDLQEPLRKIRQFGSILRERYAPSLDAEGNDLIVRMEASASRMSVLIKDLLAYSRLSTRQQSYQPQHLNRIVEEVLTVLELAVQEKQAIITVGNMGWVVGDETQLAQLFQNLLTNALKFIRPNEQPRIQISSQLIRSADLPADFQSVNLSPLFHLIRVSDNGIGFAPHQAERIFGAFQRLHGRSEYPGTGIGLAIAKKVVENHRGYIMAEGRPGAGATFLVYLPAVDAP